MFLIKYEESVELCDSHWILCFFIFNREKNNFSTFSATLISIFNKVNTVVDSIKA